MDKKLGKSISVYRVLIYIVLKKFTELLFLICRNQLFLQQFCMNFIKKTVEIKSSQFLLQLYNIFLLVHFCCPRTILNIFFLRQLFSPVFLPFLAVVFSVSNFSISSDSKCSIRPSGRGRAPLYRATTLIVNPLH